MGQRFLKIKEIDSRIQSDIIKTITTTNEREKSGPEIMNSDAEEILAIIYFGKERNTLVF
jgi:hypothetical protein